MIEVIALKGTNSISGDRITINENFSTLAGGINDLITILNSSTGAFDNSSYADGNITTKNITVQQSLNVIENVVIDNGDLTISTSNKFKFNTSSEVSHATVNKISSGAFNIIKFGTDLVKMPRLTSTQIADINTAGLEGGETVYDIDMGVLRTFNGVSFV